MLPFFPSLPGQVQAQAGNDPALQQAPMLLNPPQFPSSSSAHQNPAGFNRPPRFPPLPHGQNPRFPAPSMNNFNTQNTQMNNFHRSNPGIHNQQNSTPLHCFPNPPNVQPMNHMGIPPRQFAPQLFPPQNVNQVMAALQVLQQNLPQFHGQNNLLGQLQNNNLTPQLQPGGQFCAPNMQVGQPYLQNPLLGGNQASPFQFPLQHSASNIQPFNIPPASQSLMVSHNPGNVGNPRMALAGSNPNFGNGAAFSSEAMQCKNQNPQLFSANTPMGQNAVQKPPLLTQKLQPSFSPSPMQTHQTRKNMQPYRHQQHQFQVNHVHGYGKRESTHTRLQNFQFHAKNTKGNMGPFTKNGRKGQQKRGERDNFSSPKQAQTEQRRPLPVFYTEKEIKQWREARKKNFPSSGNIEKRLARLNRDQENTDVDAKLRCQQLKEVLAKQAELGVEVAEIPSSYLSEPEEKTGKQKNQRWSRGTEARPLNKHNKRKKRNQYGRGPKRPKTGNEASTKAIGKGREPTLLQKLLSADVKRDKSRLLQVFRFMVLNSFFERWPNKPLEFPAITVKGENCERNDVDVEDDRSLGGVDAAGYDAGERAVDDDIEGLKNRCAVDAEDVSDDDDGDDDDDGGGDEDDERNDGCHRDGEEVANHMMKDGHVREQYEESEEGEING